MKKFLLIFFSFLLAIPTLAGNDQSIVCDSSGCRNLGSLPLFNETNTYPGYQKSQSVKIQNNRDGECNLVFSTLKKVGYSETLPNHVFVDVVGNSISQNDTLSQFYILGNRSLGKIPVGNSATYTWTAELDPTLSNEFQGKSTKFDIDFNFSCITPSVSDPTPTSVSNSGVCNNPTPNATSIYSITDNNDGTALIRWNNVVGPYTHYLISFGPDRNTFLYGAPNVGSDNKYTVRGLTPNSRYCFYVKPINGCAPGPASNVWCINPNATPGTSVPDGFSPGVLGAETSVTPTPTLPTPTSAVDVGSVQGASSCSRFWLPILFVFAFLLNLIISEPTSFFRRYIITFALSLIAFLIDWYMLQSRCCLVHPIFCQYFWIGNILSYLLPFIFKKSDK